MQGQRSKLTTLPETIGFDHGSSSNDAAIESWTSLQASAENRVPQYMLSSNDTNSQYLHHSGLNGEWSLGESSSQNQSDHSERKREHTWSIRSRSALNLEQSSNILSLGTNQTENASSILQISGPNSISQDLNMCSEFRDSEVDDLTISVRSSNEIMPHMVSSSDAFGGPSDYRPGCSMDGQRVPCKRKALEVQTGQSSGAGSSSNVGMSEHSLLFGGGPEPSNSGVRLGVGGAVSANPLSLSAETSRRNLRLRFNGSHHLDHRIPISNEANVGNSNVPSSRHSSRLVLRNHLQDLQPTPPVENGSHYSQPVLSNVRNPQTRWSVASSSRTAERERIAMLYQESVSGSIPRSISEHPVFAPASEMGSSSQQPTNWSSIGGNVASTSRASGVNSSSPWSHRSYPQYPRRLTEIVRRSLLSSVGTESGGQNSNNAIQSSSPGISQEMAVSGHHISNSRAALLERHLDGAFGLPHSLRSLSAASEGRSSIMSEIRHVLDIMRRGEGLRAEDMMILDHSVFFGMADALDRHHDMRMDVDDMSYEELLALGERIGDVCTGLNEETILRLLKQRKYRNRSKNETEPCSICREEYNDGEDMGILECGHDFHRDCIKQWLMHKNLCPICKMTGLTK